MVSVTARLLLLIAGVALIAGGMGGLIESVSWLLADPSGGRMPLSAIAILLFWYSAIGLTGVGLIAWGWRQVYGVAYAAAARLRAAGESLLCAEPAKSRIAAGHPSPALPDEWRGKFIRCERGPPAV